jgi:hypothetical protein
MKCIHTLTRDAQRIIFSALIIFMLPVILYGNPVELHDTSQLGIKTFYGASFGKFEDDYLNETGLIIYTRKIVRLNLINGHSLYPEFRLGWTYIPNRTESSRSINMMPVHFNFFWDWQKLHFKTGAGDFAVNPFAGFGFYYINYRSSGKNISGPGMGYQLGVEAEYTHPGMKNLYVSFGIEHQYISDFDYGKPDLLVTAGAGYSFDMK